MNKEETVCFTQTEINAAINALENTSRIINYLNQDLLASDNRELAWGPDFMENKDIRNLREEVKSAWEILSKAQDAQIYKEEREKSK